VMEAGILAREYITAVTLNAGENYIFKVQARNAVGFSADSAQAIIRAARIPDAPTGVITSFASAEVQISWTKPYNGGSLITAYTIEIRHSDGISFSEDDTYCDGVDATLVSTRTCSIPVDKIRAAPYLQDWGAHIWARVKAINVVGPSQFSAEGNGAQIITNPDPPTLLADVPEITSKTQIGLVWQAPVFDGGVDIIDYRIWYTTETEDNYVVLDSAILGTTFTAISLTTGTSYKFKVQSRNMFDYSELSSEVIILAASPPSKPAAPVTIWSDATNSVTVSWTEPETNGAGVLSYIVKVRESDGASFSQELNGCDGSN
jgi:hypothetical protein